MNIADLETKCYRLPHQIYVGINLLTFEISISLFGCVCAVMTTYRCTMSWKLTLVIAPKRLEGAYICVGCDQIGLYKVSIPCNIAIIA